MWKVQKIFKTGALQALVHETVKHGMDIIAIREVRGSTKIVFNMPNTFSTSEAFGHNFGAGLLVKNSILPVVQNIEIVLLRYDAYLMV